MIQACLCPPIRKYYTLKIKTNSQPISVHWHRCGMSVLKLVQYFEIYSVCRVKFFFSFIKQEYFPIIFLLLTDQKPKIENSFNPLGNFFYFFYLTKCFWGSRNINGYFLQFTLFKIIYGYRYIRRLGRKLLSSKAGRQAV